MNNLGRVAVAVLVLMLAVFAAGCGGDSDEDSANDETTAVAEESAPGGDEAAAENESAGQAGGEGQGQSQRSNQRGGNFSGDGSGGSQNQGTRDHNDSGGGSEQYRVPGGDNSVQEYGEEAERSEFEQASHALHSFLDARRVGKYEVACEHLSSQVTESLQQFAQGSDVPTDCVSILRLLTEPMPPQALRQASVADVGAVRTDGENGFIMYNGHGGSAMFIPVEREDDTWKIASLGGAPLG